MVKGNSKTILSLLHRKATVKAGVQRRKMERRKRGKYGVYKLPQGRSKENRKLGLSGKL